MSPSSAWSCGLSTKLNRPSRTIASHSSVEFEPAARNTQEQDRHRCSAEDQRLAADVRQPAGDDRAGTRKTMSAAVHQRRGRAVEAEHPVM